MQVGQLQREAQLGQQLAGEDQAAVHHAENHRVALGKFAVDGVGDLADGRLDLGFGVQAVGFGQDLADVCEIGGHGNSSGFDGSRTGLPQGNLNGASR
ncbi:hypothetical protein D3C76_1266610 [compost metagenome]